jgi:hypothetical protein
MKKARLCSIPGTEGAFRWRWEECASDVKSARTSARTFEHYFDCLVDARANGYDVDLTYAQGAKAPGGAGFNLSDKGRDEQ